MITLTREEAQQVLDAFAWELGGEPLGTEINKAVETLRARLSAPEPSIVEDAIVYGTGITMGGKRIAPDSIYKEPEPEPVRLRRGDILRCIETNELCTVWATSTTGKTQVKWKANDFGSYTAEQIGDLFWVEPKPEPEPVAWFTEDHREDKSATTYSKKMAARWKEKGWPVTPLYTAPKENT
jgi:hypothetical protein